VAGETWTTAQHHPTPRTAHGRVLMASLTFSRSYRIVAPIERTPRTESPFIVGRDSRLGVYELDIVRSARQEDRM
jgi:hypothetical protein